MSHFVIEPLGLAPATGPPGGGMGAGAGPSPGAGGIGPGAAGPGALGGVGAGLFCGSIIKPLKL